MPRVPEHRRDLLERSASAFLAPPIRWSCSSPSGPARRRLNADAHPSIVGRCAVGDGGPDRPLTSNEQTKSGRNLSRVRWSGSEPAVVQPAHWFSFRQSRVRARAPRTGSGAAQMMDTGWRRRPGIRSSWTTPRLLLSRVQPDGCHAAGPLGAMAMGCRPPLFPSSASSSPRRQTSSPCGPWAPLIRSPSGAASLSHHRWSNAPASARHPPERTPKGSCQERSARVSRGARTSARPP
jgi:hypothetical protein